MSVYYPTQLKDFMIRTAERKDVPTILAFIKKLAIYEHLEDQVVATEKALEKTLFDHAYAEVLLGIHKDQVIGFALFFHNYSTFLGRPNLFLEDLYIDEPYRGFGYGKKMFQCLAKIADERGCQRLDWSCLDWNESSIDFYEGMGAIAMRAWIPFRLHGEALKALARSFDQ